MMSGRLLVRQISVAFGVLYLVRTRPLEGADGAEPERVALGSDV
jgi:hypothetical protein